MPAVPVQGQQLHMVLYIQYGSDASTYFDETDMYPAYPGTLSLLQTTLPVYTVLRLAQVSHVWYVMAHSLRWPQTPYAAYCQVPVAVFLFVTMHVQLRLVEL